MDAAFLNYCLTCDREIQHPDETRTPQVYCSQECRLADLCTSPNASSGSAASPTPYNQHSTSHNHSISIASTSSTSSQRHSSTFILPPAYDFSSHRNSTVSVASSTQSSSSPSQSTHVPAPTRPASGYFAYAGTGNMLLSSSEAAKKTLSPTSSRSSITSSIQDIQTELRLYESGFDQVRAWRRRRQSVYESIWKN